MIGFASGVGVALIGAVVGYALQRRAEKKHRIEETQFQIYMKLMDLYSLYFWVASLELRGEEVNPDLKKKIRNITWQIADLLRFEDSVLYTEKILWVLMSNKYPTANARYDEMKNIVDEFGSLINPRYQNVIKIIGEGNMQRLGSGERSFLKSTTPASMEPF